MSSSASAVLLSGQSEAYTDGYEARQRGEPITSFNEDDYISPLAEDWWKEGWTDADKGEPNMDAPSGTLPTKLQFWGFVVFLIALLAALNWLSNVIHHPT